jgi:hypothetical protein
MKKLLLSLLLIFCVTSVSAQTTGCTDPTAANYNPFSSIDDSTCIYGCFLPDSIWVSDTTHNSFTVSFNLQPNATQYRVKYKEITSNTWITKYGSSSPITIENLSIATIYDYMFRTICGSVGNSPWSPTYQITTLNIMGCMDDRAVNYNPLATADDGTCNYSCIKKHWAKNITNHTGIYNTVGNIYGQSTISIQNDNFYFGLNGTNTSCLILDTSLVTVGSGADRFAVASMNLDGELNWAINPTNCFILNNGFGVRLSTVKVSDEGSTYISFTSQDMTSLTMGDVTISGIDQNTDGALLLAKIDKHGLVENIEYISDLFLDWAYHNHPLEVGDNSLYISGFVYHGYQFDLHNNSFGPPPFGSEGWSFLQRLDTNLNHIWSRYFSTYFEIQNIFYAYNNIYVEGNYGGNDPIFIYDGLDYTDTLIISADHFLKFNTSGDLIDAYDDTYQ